MKKILLSLLLMLAATASAWADEGVIVQTTDGEEVGYIFDNEPVFTYEGDNLVVTSADANATYPMDEVAKVYFGDIANTGVAEVANKQVVRFVQDGVELSGFAAGTAVSVYDLNGRLVSSLRTRADGTLNVSLAACEPGIYIIKADKSTLKIKK